MKIDSKGKWKEKVGQRKIAKDHIETFGKYMIKNKGKQFTDENI